MALAERYNRARLPAISHSASATATPPRPRRVRSRASRSARVAHLLPSAATARPEVDLGRPSGSCWPRSLGELGGGLRLANGQRARSRRPGCDEPRPPAARRPGRRRPCRSGVGRSAGRALGVERDVAADDRALTPGSLSEGARQDSVAASAGAASRVAEVEVVGGAERLGADLRRGLARTSTAAIRAPAGVCCDAPAVAVDADGEKRCRRAGLARLHPPARGGRIVRRADDRVVCSKSGRGGQSKGSGLSSTRERLRRRGSRPADAAAVRRSAVRLAAEMSRAGSHRLAPARAMSSSGSPPGRAAPASARCRDERRSPQPFTSHFSQTAKHPSTLQRPTTQTCAPPGNAENHQPRKAPGRLAGAATASMSRSIPTRPSKAISRS